MTRSSRRLAAAAAALLSCSSELVESAPRPTSVVPPVGRRAAHTQIAIVGDGFLPQPYQDANGRPRLDTRFRAWLDDVELHEVAWMSEAELRARVPLGLGLGAHRLEVLGPTGGAGALDAAFTTLPGGIGPVLEASASLIPGVTVSGKPVTVRVSVTNAGDVPAMGVGLSVLVTGAAVAPPASLPLPVDLAPGEAHVFEAACMAVAVGTADLTIDVAGTDPDTGLPVVTRVYPGTVIVQAREAWQALADPFADGATFSFVFGYAGRVFLGPSRDGSGLVGCLPDGTGCASYALSFRRDTTGSTLLPDLLTSVSENTVCASLTTFGAAPACNPVTPQTTACACGPDYEVGRGILGSVSIGGAEWLAAMGRVEKAGDLGYAYMTRESPTTASPLGFSYVDLYTAMPASAMVTDATAMAVLNDRLYLGLQVVDGEKPRLVVLTRTPSGPGLDCGSADAFATTLRQTAMDESGPGVTQIDALLGFEGRLFVANRRAVLVSRTGYPTAARDARTQFDDCTPPAAGGWEATSVVKYAGKIDVTPADRGVTAMVAWAGRLYLGRNTRPVPSGTSPAVPELWVFTPRHDAPTGAFLGCAPGDWQRIATNFADPTSASLTALFASASGLYAGYDSPGGARLFRTTSPAPSGEWDFRGSAGCTAPCTPLGTAGLGDVANTRFLDARAIPFAGVDQVWATLGSGAGGVRVYRISE